MINPPLTRFTLDPLPYGYDALEPVISAETLQYHHEKHHQGYVDQLNRLLPGSGFEETSLLDIVKKSNGPIYNQAAQHWNHDFYWKSMESKSTAHPPDGELIEAIEKQFESFENFKLEFEKKAATLFGSGWLWLVANTKGEVLLLLGENAENPIRQGLTPLLVCDLWEHAYYIDYRNSRNAYAAVFLEIINWDFAEANYAPIIAKINGKPGSEAPRKKSA